MAILVSNTVSFYLVTVRTLMWSSWFQVCPAHIGSFFESTFSYTATNEGAAADLPTSYLGDNGNETEWNHKESSSHRDAESVDMSLISSY